MNRMNEFYKKLMENEDARKKVQEILGSKPVGDATDEELNKIGEIAAALGYEFTIEEVREFFNGDEKELDEEDLEAVAGGKNEIKLHYIYCEIGGGSEAG